VKIQRNKIIYELRDLEENAEILKKYVNEDQTGRTKYFLEQALKELEEARKKSLLRFFNQADKI